jgi:hypothetical protein
MIMLYLTINDFCIIFHVRDYSDLQKIEGFLLRIDKQKIIKINNHEKQYTFDYLNKIILCERL